MSDRYTISVYLQGKIADIGYYRNWDEKDLLYEAVATAALYEDCRTVEEYRLPETVGKKALGRGFLWNNCVYREVEEEVPGYDEIGLHTEFWDMLHYSRIPLDGIDLKEVLRCIENWPEAKYHLSISLMERLKKTG